MTDTYKEQKIPPFGAEKSDDPPPRTGSPDDPLSLATAARGRPTNEAIAGGITGAPR